MQMQSLSIEFQGDTFRFHTWFGFLFRQIRKKATPLRDVRGTAFDVIVHPYLLQPRPIPSTIPKVTWKMRCWATILVKLSQRFFPLVRLLMCVRWQWFSDASVATSVFHHLYSTPEQQRTLCLARAIFAATTSQRFDAQGSLYIGAFLPSVQMHAWVIEDNMPADPWDNIWTAYQPVAIYTRKDDLIVSLAPSYAQ